MKIVHLADLHLGYRSYNKLDENGFNIREIDVFEAFRESLKAIVDINPELIIIAGDIFHKPRPSNLTIYQVLQRLIVFRKYCNALIVIISGNHESVKSLETGNVLNIIEAVVPNVIVIDGSIIELELKHLDTLLVGIPYNSLSEIKNKSLCADKNYKYNILTIHGSYDSVKCSELSHHGKQELITSNSINQSQWDYVAFGHYHKFTELAPNAFYSGAIERTTTNIWQEAGDKKGFIEFDLDTKVCRFHSLKTARKVVDIKRILADGLTGEEISRKIEQEIEKIPDFDNSIIRITIENIDPVAVRELDYKKIREYKKRTLHFRLNLIKRESGKSTTNQEESVKKKGVFEYLEEELADFELSQGIDKEKFNRLAKEYLEAGTAL